MIHSDSVRILSGFRGKVLKINVAGTRMTMSKSKTVKLVLPNLPDIEMVASKALEHLCKAYRVDGNRIDEACIVSNEAIINALEHSAKEDDVEVSYTIYPDKLVIVVKDFGIGFKKEDVPEPDIREKIHSKHKRGWGLKLMESISDHFDIISDENGTIITMYLNLQ